MMEEQLVIFQVASESYGVDVSRVQSILQMPQLTVIPGAPRFVEGVINLRGTVVPVVDLRTRLDLPAQTEQKKQVIIIVELNTQPVGIIVDRVTDVTKIPSASIQPPSPMLTSIETSYLRGIARLDERLMILLDLDRVFSSDEQQALKEAA